MTETVYNMSHPASTSHLSPWYMAPMVEEEVTFKLHWNSLSWHLETVTLTWTLIGHSALCGCTAFVAHTCAVCSTKVPYASQGAINAYGCQDYRATLPRAYLSWRAKEGSCTVWKCSNEPLWRDILESGSSACPRSIYNSFEKEVRFSDEFWNSRLLSIFQKVRLALGLKLERAPIFLTDMAFYEVLATT